MCFLTTNQLFYFRFDIDKVIRQTYTHAHQHTYTEIYIHSCMHVSEGRKLYRTTLLHMHEFIHKYKPPPIIPSTTDNGKMIFIHSGYFSLSPLLLAPDHSN